MWNSEIDKRNNQHYVGLENTGVNCYSNSILQIFFNTSLFKNNILALNLESFKNDEDRIIISQLQCLFKSMQESNVPFVTTKGFTSAIKWNSTNQEDGEEYYVNFLVKLSEILDKGQNPKQGPIFNCITHFYEGTLDISRICLKCFKFFPAFEDFFILHLSLEESVESALSSYCKPELIRFECDNCINQNIKPDTTFEQKKDKEILNAEKRNNIVVMPKVLTMSLNRFQFIPDINDTIKLNNRVTFQEVLHVEVDKVIMAYHLKGIIVHSGDTNAGHYYSLIKNFSHDHWRKFNDKVVSSPMTWEEIKVAFGDGSSGENAYILVYVQEDIILESKYLGADCVETRKNEKTNVSYKIDESQQIEETCLQEPYTTVDQFVRSYLNEEIISISSVSTEPEIFVKIENVSMTEGSDREVLDEDKIIFTKWWLSNIDPDIDDHDYQPISPSADSIEKPSNFDLKNKPSISLLFDDEFIKTKYKLTENTFFMKAMAKYLPDVQTIDKNAMPPPKNVPTRKKEDNTTEEGSLYFSDASESSIDTGSDISSLRSFKMSSESSQKSVSSFGSKNLRKKRLVSGFRAHCPNCLKMSKTFNHCDYCNHELPEKALMFSNSNNLKEDIKLQVSQRNDIDSSIESDNSSFKSCSNILVDSKLSLSSINLRCKSNASEKQCNKTQDHVFITIHSSSSSNSSCFEKKRSNKVIKKSLPSTRKGSKLQNTITIYPPPPTPGGIVINDIDFKCLSKNNYLNDTIIDFYLKTLEIEKLTPELQSQTYVFSSHFFTRLTRNLDWNNYCSSDISQNKMMYENVKKWTKNVDILKKNFYSCQ